MARNVIQPLFSRAAVVTPDTPFPTTAPTTTTVINGIPNLAPTNPLPANMVATGGPTVLIVDTFVASGTATVQLLAWNASANKWVIAGNFGITATGNQRNTVNSWYGDYAYIYIPAVSNSVDVYIAAGFQTG